MAEAIVVVGAGQAGSSVVACLRKNGFAGSIMLLGAEKWLPYQRPPLSKAFLLGEVERDRLLLKPSAFYVGKDIEVITGMPAETIDRSNRVVHAGGRQLHFDHAVLATGSRPRRLDQDRGGELEGVHYLRTQDDALSLGTALRPGHHLMVVGGGYIGLEVAAVAAKTGLKVTVVEFTDRILQRVAAKPTSDYFRRLHLGHGVDIREGVGLSEFRGSTKVASAVLNDGTEMEIDAAVVGIGVDPNIELALESGIETENGIKVDEFGRTSDPHIWAAGDCCSFPYKGTRVRLESVPHAIDQAEAIAENIMGKGRQYSAKPWFWSDQYDVKLQIAGLNTGFNYVVERGSVDSLQRSVWYYRDQDLVAVDAMNDARSYIIGRKMLDNGYSPPPDHVANTLFDLKALV
ncbi:3-phenylpropionate/trans-cinnamate dioxygenase ferredoxin reductase subunit [Rhizobiales bacterium GAS188]|nr:3-phenylpropionate/trans-cinnamate dioxygenase ferredoxin reductase subunit [Rhizobiales bacterium GAS188]